MERGKRGQGGSRASQLHAGTFHRIEHPGSHLYEQSWPQLDDGERDAGMILNGFYANPSSGKSMPAVVDDTIRPDMGRMTGR